MIAIGIVVTTTNLIETTHGPHLRPGQQYTTIEVQNSAKVAYRFLVENIYQ